MPWIFLLLPREALATDVALWPRWHWERAGSIWALDSWRRKRGLELYETGALDRGIVACGQVVGLVHDIPTVKELIDRIIKEAEDVASRITARGTFKPLRKPSGIANQP